MSERNEATRSLRRSSRSVRGERRSRITVTLSRRERVMLEQKALATGVSMSRLLVESALHTRSTNEVSVSEFSALVAELEKTKLQLVGIARNINQIAHHANATQIITDEILPAADAARAVADSITALIEDVNR